MIRNLFLGIIFLGGLGLATESEILARVNGQQILVNDFKQVIKDLHYDQQMPGLSRTRMSILEDLIKNILVTQQAEKMAITVSSADVRQKVKLLTYRFPSKSDFEEALVDEGVYNDESLYVGVKQQMLIDKIQEKILADVKISQKEIDTYIADNKKQFVFSRKFQLQQIVVPTQSVALEIAEALSDGEDFSVLAKKYSLDEESGIETSYIEEDILAPEILYAVNNAKVGEVIGPLKIEDNYYLIKYSSVIEAEKLAQADVRKKVAAFLIESKKEQIFNQWFDSIRNSAQVEINRKYQYYLNEKI